MPQGAIDWDLLLPALYSSTAVVGFCSVKLYTKETLTEQKKSTLSGTLLDSDMSIRYVEFKVWLRFELADRVRLP